jgi:hypothetical protein
LPLPKFDTGNDATLEFDALLAFSKSKQGRELMTAFDSLPINRRGIKLSN